MSNVRILVSKKNGIASFNDSAPYKEEKHHSYESYPGKDGLDGPPGKDGLDGPPGKDGLDGPPGKDGKDGLNGADGKDGANGLDGPPGKDGLNGADGKDGANGLDGPSGKDGVDGLEGLPGKDGLNGFNGRDGVDGFDGKDGAVGPPGKDGSNGTVGLPGNNGADGKDGVPGKDGNNFEFPLKAPISSLPQYSFDDGSGLLLDDTGMALLYGDIPRIKITKDSINLTSPFSTETYFKKICAGSCDLITLPLKEVYLIDISLILKDSSSSVYRSKVSVQDGKVVPSSEEISDSRLEWSINDSSLSLKFNNATSVTVTGKLSVLSS